MVMILVRNNKKKEVGKRKIKIRGKCESERF